MSLERSLAEVLAHHLRAGNPIPVPLALSIIRQVCDNLDYAHNLRDAAGQPLWIVHRDVSPGHIWIADNGVVRLIASPTPHGTPAYVPPELVMAGLSDPRGDVWSLGVIAHEMLANRPLFAGADPQDTINRVCGLPIEPPSAINPGVPREIDGIVLMALGRDPAYRWQSAAMMRDGLLAICERFGFQVSATEWADLLALRDEPRRPPPAAFGERTFAPTAPLLGPPDEPAAPLFAAPTFRPPSEAEVWSDETDNETVIKPMIEALPEVVTFKKPAAPAPAPSAPAPAPAPVALAPPAPAPAPIAEPPANPAGFELDIPEGTQIGAVPLISFDSKTPAPGPSLSALVAAPRRSTPTLAPSFAMSLPQVDDEDDVAAKKKKRLIIVGIGAAVLAVVAIVLVLFVL